MAATRSEPSADRPRVSVIVATHDRPALLGAALASVGAQQGAGDEFRVETLVVDDASREPAASIANRFPGTRCLRLDRNRGPAAARNVGLAASRGAFLVFLDDDDELLPHHVRTLLGLLARHPEAGVAYGQVGYEASGPWPDRNAPSGDVFGALLASELVCTHAALIRRDALERAGPFDETLPTMEHHDLFVRLARHTRFVFYPDLVARSRFARTGLWFSSIVRGDYERAVVRILEQALAGRPRAERTALERRARVTWFPRIAYWTAQAGGADRHRDFVLRWLADCPWLVAEPAACVALHVGRAAAALAVQSSESLAPVAAFAARVAVATAGQPWLGRRRVLGELWLAVARALAQAPGRRLAAARAARLAVHAYPPLARRLDVVALAARRRTPAEVAAGRP